MPHTLTLSLLLSSFKYEDREFPITVTPEGYLLLREAYLFTLDYAANNACPQHGIMGWQLFHGPVLMADSLGMRSDPPAYIALSPRAPRTHHRGTPCTPRRNSTSNDPST